MKTQTLPRGLRNNNPLNIEKKGDKWRGMDKDQKDSRFITFIAPEYGYRAGLIILKNYQRRYALCTLEQMIERWAPRNENNTKAYIQTVSQRSGIPPNRYIDLNNRDTSIRLLEAMSFVENGIAGNIIDITKGVDMVK